MERYPSYKDSGNPRIREYPSHWALKRLRYFAKICNGRDQKEVLDSEGTFPVLGTGGIFGRATDFLHDKPSVLLGRKGTIDNPIFISEPFWTVDTLYYTDINQTTDPKYFYYLCKTINFDKYKTGSAVPSMTQEDLNEIYFTSPPLPEQEAIASFLDHKTKLIDDLIAKKQRLIELKKEERAAIINQAVTKGLDPDVRMKDSGIEWIGEIPEHWSIVRMKYKGESIIGLTYAPGEITNDGQNGTLVLRASNIQNGKFSQADSVYVDKKIPEDLIVQLGDILICARSGSSDLIGKNILINEELHGSSFGAFMTVFRSPLNKFIYFVLNSPLFKSQTTLFATTTINQLTTHTLNNFSIALPPLPEQAAITSYLNQIIKQIDRIVQEITEQIDLLKEYKTTLISEAVTGKIDVRDYQIENITA